MDEQNTKTKIYLWKLKKNSNLILFLVLILQIKVLKHNYRNSNIETFKCIENSDERKSRKIQDKTPNFYFLLIFLSSHKKKYSQIIGKVFCSYFKCEINGWKEEANKEEKRSKELLYFVENPLDSKQ